MYRIREHVDMAQKGIPEKYRVEIWMVYSGELVARTHTHIMCLKYCTWSAFLWPVLYHSLDCTPCAVNSTNCYGECPFELYDDAVL